MMPMHLRLQRSDTTGMGHSVTPPPRPRQGRRLSLQPQPSSQPSLSPPSSRLRRSPSPTPPKSRTAASTPTKSDKTGPKIMMLGAKKVGKTSIVTRFLKDEFNPKYKRTIEQSYEAAFPIGGACLTLNILDTSGNGEFPAMTELNIRASSAFILVYAVNDHDSFDQILAIRNDVVQAKADKGIPPIVVVGNKTDLEESDRKVDEDQARKIVTRWKHGYVECSAKTGEGVTEVFKELLNQAKVSYKLSPALRKRRQSLPGNGSNQPTSWNVPTPEQLAALRKLNDKNSKDSSGRKPSCNIS